MKYFSRPYLCFGVAALLGLGVAMTPRTGAQTSEIANLLKSPQMLLHSSTPGYLGVLVGDVDQDAATRLKLKDAKGAVVTLIDHDAPAAQAGIRVNDVLLKLNGQAVENAEDFGRILHELPAGRTVSIELSRDGNVQTIAVQLVDRKKMEHEVWTRIDEGGDEFTSVPSMGMLSGGGANGNGGNVPSSGSGGFHLPWFGSSLNVGALVEPLTSQMAEYLGVASGLMVKQVARKSEAAVAGMKAFDVILKVGTETVSTVSDWDRALRSNRGKTVQVTILRDRKQQTLTLQVDSKHKRGELEDLFPDANCEMMAMLDTDMAQDLARQLADQADQIREQTQTLRDQLEQQMQKMPRISQEQAEAVRREAEQLAQRLQSQKFQLDQKQRNELQRQMEQFKKQFKPEDFQLSPQQKEKLRRQMDQLKRQMEEMQAQGLGQFV